MMPVPKYMTKGEMKMATIPTIRPKYLPTFTVFSASASLPQIGCQISSAKMVEEEFSTELKEDRIAPNITAAKNPIIAGA